MESVADFHIYSVHSCQSPKLGHKKAATAAGRLAVRRNGMFLIKTEKQNHFKDNPIVLIFLNVLFMKF